ncbi:MAG: hypothetical protein WBD10_13325 [Acidobacteriaceae bacterium]
MNHYLFLHRIKLPVLILVVGITALLAQWHILSWSRSWPLYLIAFGLLQLAERAAWSRMQTGVPPPPGYSGVPAPDQDHDRARRANWGSSTSLSITPRDPAPHDEEGK